MRIENPRHMRVHPLRGALFETFVVMELVKQRFNQGKPSNLYFWRDNTGHEIDLILDFGDRVFPIEIKSGQTVARDFFQNLDFYRKINPNCKKAALIYGGQKTFVERDTWVVSYQDIDLFSELDYRLEWPKGN